MSDVNKVALALTNQMDDAFIAHLTRKPDLSPEYIERFLARAESFGASRKFIQKERKRLTEEMNAHPAREKGRK